MAAVWEDWTQKNKEKGGWHKEKERRRRYEDRHTMVCCNYWKAKVIKWCVVYFDHPLGLCLVFCIVFMTLLTALLLLASALKQNPFRGMESSPQSLVLCRPVLWWSKGTGAAGQGQNSVLPYCSVTESLNHLGWVLEENLRSDKAQLCVWDPAHRVLSFYRCLEKVGTEQAQAGMAD